MLAPNLRTLASLLALTLVGCSSARTTDVLEARLRSQEDMLAVYESEMARVKSELASARNETEDLRLRLAENGTPMMSAEESGAAFRATGIQLSSLMTGGLDFDGEPGHDGLSVVLIPHDPDGELVKLPGNIEIEALDPAHPEGAQRIGHWTFDQRDIHEFWHKGVIQSGYQFELPWQTPPRSDQVLVLAHLSTANGRRFDTTLTVKIDPEPGNPNVPMVPGVQQATATNPNPFAVEQADLERPANRTADDTIIWADGEGPATSERRLQPDRMPTESDLKTPAVSNDASQFESRMSTQRPATDRVPRPQPLGNHIPETRTETAVSRDVPPAIEDWWSDEDWATMDANREARGLRTSDSFTDETLPQYR